VGRFDEIVARNQKPFRLASSRGMIVRGIFLLLILALFLFTSWGTPPEDKRPGINVVPGPQDAKPVRGVKLYRAPAK
jgi:hypothetical protein